MGPKAAPQSSQSIAAGALKPRQTTHGNLPGAGQAHVKPVHGVASKRTVNSSNKKCRHISASGNKSQYTSVHSGAHEPSGNRVTTNAGSSSHTTGSSASRVPNSSMTPGKPVCDTRSRQEERKDRGIPKVGDRNSLVKIVVFISQDREDDYYFNRHVKAHFTSPQVPNLHETVHAAYTRLGGSEQWEVLRDHDKTEHELRMSNFFYSKMDPVWVTVGRGQEMVPANIFANVSVTDRESDWNCQNFLLEGFKKLAERGYKTMQWYDNFEDELLDELMLGARA